MKIYNTMTRREEDLNTLRPGEVSIYACGPTVYNLIHLGNARPICVFDTLRRYLTYRGYKVTYVQNFTDVDDKIIRKANEKGVDSSVISERYIAEYKKDAAGLNVMPADYHPQVTRMMDEIVAFIQTLVDKGFAYEVNGDVYYRTHAFPEYGKLSHQPLADLEAGARIEVGDMKEHPADFALWKAAKPGEPHWPSPWSEGRPGWHIECSTMAKSILGDTIDIHCGGEDLQFPHHENEIAQSEAANGCKFVNYWLHNGFLNIDNQKMSKSLGNFFTVREAAEAYGYEAVRFFMLSAQYRSPLNYSRDSLIMAQNSLDRLYTAESNLEFLTKNGADGDLTAEEKAFTETFDSYRQKFDDAMDDDLNTADAISVIFELVRAMNIAVEKEPTKALAAACLEMLHEFTEVLGLLYNKKEEENLDEKVEAMIQARQEARKAKNFAEADRIRDELKAMGITLMDTPQGVKWAKS